MIKRTVKRNTKLPHVAIILLKGNYRNRIIVDSVSETINNDIRNSPYIVLHIKLSVLYHKYHNTKHYNIHKPEVLSRRGI